LETLEYRIKYRSRRDEFHLHGIGDAHGGLLHCAEKQLKSRIKQITEDPFGLAIGMGDLADCITPSDPRWDEGVIAPWVDYYNIAECQREWAVNLLWPIKDQLLGLLDGNHEDALRRRNHVDIMANICKDLGVRRLRASALIAFKFDRGRKVTQIDGSFEHGSGWAQTEGGVINRLKKGLLRTGARFHMMGHLHWILMTRSFPLNLDANIDLTDQQRIAVCTGGWLRGYMQNIPPSYVEKMGKEPLPIGAPVINLRPGAAVADQVTVTL